MVTWLLFLAAAYAAFAFATCLSKRKRLSGFGAIVPFEERAGAAASHGSRIELSPSEALLLKTGAVLSGLYKVALMVTVEERVPRRAIQAAAAALAARHPALRCKAVVVPPGPITSSSRVALEVDESIQLPLAFHECSEAATLTDAATAVWRSVEKVPFPAVIASPSAQISLSLAYLCTHPPSLPSCAEGDCARRRPLARGRCDSAHVW